MNTQIFYVIGTTCAGKDYFMERAKEQFPDLVGLVQVGKEFRRRYPPGYFQGSAAPLHTKQEAIDIFNEQLEACFQKNYKYIFVAGQPRRVSQIEQTIMKYPGKLLWIYAEEEILHQRAQTRGNAATVQLSLDRITNDKVQIFDMLYQLMFYEFEILPIHTQDIGIWINRIIYERV